MKKKIVLVGGGGHCKVVIDALKRSKNYSIYGIVDPALRRGCNVSGVRVVGNDSDLQDIFKKGIGCAFITVGSMGNCQPRKKIYNNLIKIGFKLPYVIHPAAVIADDVKIAEGAFIAAGAVINSGTTIGKNAIINTSSSLDHDCQIGDFVHIAPGVILNGGVEIKSGAHLGTGTKVTQGAIIEQDKFIKAGSLVFKNSDGVTSIIDMFKAFPDNEKVF